MKSIYLIGSLRNPAIIGLGQEIRALGFDVFDDWVSAGKFADDEWQAYEQARGHRYDEALKGYAAQHVFQFDLKHLQRCDIGVLALPAGRSGHIELGFMLGQGKKGYILFDDGMPQPDRFDVMYNFSTAVLFGRKDLFNELQKEK